MSTNMKSADSRMPVITESDLTQIQATEFAQLVTNRYGEETTTEAKAFRKISTMLSSEQGGGISVPKNLTYWAWKSLTAEGDPDETAARARLAMSTVEIGAPIFGTDMDDLDAIANGAESGEELSGTDKEVLDDCLRLAFKWIDVAVRTKSNRSGLKDVAVKVA